MLICCHFETDIPGQFVRIQKNNDANKKRKAEPEAETSEKAKKSE